MLQLLIYFLNLPWQLTLSKYLVQCLHFFVNFIIFRVDQVGLFICKIKM